MRRPEDIASVLMPTLQGEHYYAIVGHEGYGVGVLAKNRAGFIVALRRLVVDENHVDALYPPAHIRVVSPRGTMLEDVRVEHSKQLRTDHMRHLANNVGRYWELVGGLPEGFARTTQSAKRKMYLGSDDKYRAHYAKWVGTGDPCARYAADFVPDYRKSEGAPSIAPMATGDVHVAWRGWDGGIGEKPWARSFYADDVLKETPAFYFEIVEALPDVMAPLIEERRAAKAQDEIDRVKWRVDSDARRAVEREKEREALLRLFGQPVVVTKKAK